MKMYYKPLDITQLSGSPWNTAEKVLGLDQDDKVIMAEPEETVTPEYVDEAIDQAMEAETARTEDTYAKKSEVPDLDDYYTKEEVDEAISGITVDLSDYYTKEEVDELIDGIPEPDLSDYYTKSETDGAIDTALEPYATKGWVESKTYVNGAFVDAKVNEAMQSETARTESTYAKKSEIPSLDGYATEEYVDEAIAAIPQVDLSGYAKTTAVTQDIQTAIAAETARTESTYLKEHQSLDNYYTKAQVDSAITRVEEEIPLVPVNVSAFVNDAGYLTEHQSLAGLFNSASYDSETKRINFYDKSNVLSSYIDATAFIKDGMVERVYITGSTLVVSFNTDAGTEDIELDLTDVFDPANYYTKDQVDNLMAAETARTESTYLKEHQSLANYYNKGQVDGMFSSAATLTANAIDAAETRANAYAESVVDGYATEQYVDDAIAAIPAPEFPTDYATTGDVASAVEGLASEQYVDDAIAAIPSPDLSEYATHSEVNNAVNDLALGIGMLGMVNDVSANGGTVTVRKTGMENGQIVTGSTSFNIATPGDIQTAIASETARTEETYAKKSEIPSLTGYASEAYVDNAIATETARTESTYLKEHQSLANYYTKSEVDAEITGATSDLATKAELASGLLDKANWADVQTEIIDTMEAETARTESTYAKQSQIPSLTGYATEAWVEGKGYLTQHQDISGKLDKTDFNTYTGATETALAEKLDASAYTVDNAIDSASTNPVENKAVYKTLYGSESYVQMVISDVDSANRIQYRVYPGGSSKLTYLKETNIPGYYAVSINPLVQASGVGNPTFFRIENVRPENNTYRFNNSYGVSASTLGEKLYFSSEGTYMLDVRSGYLDGTFDYYLVMNTNDNYVSVYKTFPTISEITPGILDEYWTSAETQNAITAATQNYVTSGDVATQIGTAMASETARTESTYAKPSQIPSLNGYATEAWVGQQGYLTSQSLTNYYTKTEIDGMIGDIESLLASI